MKTSCPQTPRGPVMSSSCTISKLLHVTRCLKHTHLLLVTASSSMQHIHCQSAAMNCPALPIWKPAPCWAHAAGVFQLLQQPCTYTNSVVRSLCCQGLPAPLSNTTAAVGCSSSPTGAQGASWASSCIGLASGSSCSGSCSKGV